MRDNVLINFNHAKTTEIIILVKFTEREREREIKHLNKGFHLRSDLSGLRKALMDIDALPS
jgi:hypothetical protein